MDGGSPAAFGSFARRPARRRRSLPAPFASLRGFEPLEDRRLLANLNLDIQLWSLDPNQPGQKGTRIPTVQTTPVKIFEVAQGSRFLVQVLTEDQPTPTDADQQSTGVVALPLDLNWNTAAPNVIRYSGALPPLAPNPIPLSNPIVTSQFPRQRLVSAFDPLLRADDLRGATVPAIDGTTPIGIAGCNPPNGEDD
jgi:hypothetical protein